jgi:hypothetical protein
MDPQQYIQKQHAHNAAANLVSLYPVEEYQVASERQTEFDIKRAFPVILTQIGRTQTLPLYLWVPWGTAVVYDRIAKQLKECRYRQDPSTADDLPYTLSDATDIPDTEWERIACTLTRFYEDSLREKLCAGKAGGESNIARPLV